MDNLKRALERREKYFLEKMKARIWKAGRARRQIIWRDLLDVQRPD